MIRADAYSPEVWESICTPMHEILPATNRRGALFLGSWTAAVDTELLARHDIRAIVECLEASWGSASTGSNGFSTAGHGHVDSASRTNGSSHKLSSPSSFSPSAPSFPQSNRSSASRALSASLIARVPSGPCANGIRPHLPRSVTAMGGGAHAYVVGNGINGNSTNGAIKVNGDGGWGVTPGHDSIGRYKVPIPDSKTQDLIAPHLEGAVRFISERLERGENVLVHCQQGISRSPSIVLAYLMRKHSLSYDAALHLVKSTRKCAKPNEGFERTLRKWK